MDRRTEKYRHVLLSPMGLEVLDDLLQLCHFGCTLDPNNQAQVAEHNLGVTILQRCGIFERGTARQVMLALSSVSPTVDEENSDDQTT